jgi:hypothetical protein
MNALKTKIQTFNQAKKPELMTAKNNLRTLATNRPAMTDEVLTTSVNMIGESDEINTDINFIKKILHNREGVRVGRGRRLENSRDQITYDEYERKLADFTDEELENTVAMFEAKKNQRIASREKAISQANTQIWPVPFKKDDDSFYG